MDCENCVYYVFDENDECYYCMADMDEDETVRLMQSQKGCPYFRREDEYGVVRKQN
ncbi:MAG: hypothetical protein IJW78_04165 [Clostridia bacterium]|nr:hypothetical protein [Clostridia bacterium]